MLLAFIVGLTILLGLHASGLVVFSWNDAQATICPIDKVAQEVTNAQEAFAAQDYVEVGNSLESLQELVDLTKEEKE